MTKRKIVEKLKLHTLDYGPLDYDETEIENALLDLIEMPQVLPLYRYVETYISTKKERGRFNLKKLDSALSALLLCSAEFGFSHGRDFYRGGHHSPLRELDLPALEAHIWQAGGLMQGAVELVVLGNEKTTAALLRSALETGLKGMLFEHLRDHEYRVKLERNWNRYQKPEHARTVTRFYSKAQVTASRLNKPLETILCAPFHFMEDERVFISFRHIAWLLTEWNVFWPISGAAKRFSETYSMLSEIIHAQRFHSRRTRKEALEEVIKIIDNLVLGTLNTAKNLTPKRLMSSRDDFEWQIFFNHMKIGGLKHTEATLRPPWSVLRKMSFKGFTEFLPGIFATYYKGKESVPSLTHDMVIALYKRYRQSDLAFEEWLDTILD